VEPARRQETRAGLDLTGMLLWQSPAAAALGDAVMKWEMSSVPQDVRELIRRMRQENPLWGAPRIHGELLKLGIDIGETSVGKYRGRHQKPPSHTWRAFLNNHVATMVSVDFTVPRFASSAITCASDVPRKRMLSTCPPSAR
jgi:hypothetical protein